MEALMVRLVEWLAAWGDWINISIFVGLLVLGFGVGTWVEQRHFANLKIRERRTRHLSVVNFGAKSEMAAQEATLLVGSVVISADYFKTVAAALINLVGGRISVYETLLERARREALLRLKEQALAWGATQVLNVRFEACNINGESGRGRVSVEVIAYGTAVR